MAVSPDIRTVININHVTTVNKVLFFDVYWTEHLVIPEE